MKQKLSILLATVLVFGMISLQAFAASSYTVTEAAATVGTHTALEIEYTVDVAAQTWADDDTLTLTLPDNYPAWSSMTYALEFDEDADNDGVGESALTGGAGTGQYAAVGRVLTLKWDETTWTTENGDTIRILITATAIPLYADATSTFTFGGATVAEDTNPSGTDNVNVSAADPDVSISLGANSVVGEAGNTTVTFTLPLALDSADTVQFVAPANLDVSNVAYGSKTFTGAGTFTCTDSGQNVTCTSGGVIDAGLGTIVLSGVTSKYAAIGESVTGFEVEDEGVAANDIAVDPDDGTVTNTTVGDLDSTNVNPVDKTAGKETKNMIYFTTSAEIPNLGKIVIIYPTAFDLTDANGVVAGNLSGLDGTWTAVVSGGDDDDDDMITLTQTGGTASAAGAKVLSIPTGIVNPVATGASSTYTITTLTATDEEIETNAAVAADIFYRAGTGGSGDDDQAALEEEESTEEDATEDTEEDVSDDSMTDEKDTEEGDDSAEEEDEITITTESGEEKTIHDVGTHWASDEIEEMLKEEVVTGDPDGNFRPDDSLNRAEAAAIVYRVLGLGEPEAPAAKPFSDVSVDAWYAGYVSALKMMDLVNGNPDGTFDPEGEINRAEFLVMAMNTYYFKADDAGKATVDALKAGAKTDAFKDLADAWYTTMITAAAEMGFVKGSACEGGMCFNAGAEITRAEATVMLFNMFK